MIKIDTQLEKSACFHFSTGLARLGFKTRVDDARELGIEDFESNLAFAKSKITNSTHKLLGDWFIASLGQFNHNDHLDADALDAEAMAYLDMFQLIQARRLYLMVLPTVRYAVRDKDVETNLDTIKQCDGIDGDCWSGTQDEDGKIWTTRPMKAFRVYVNDQQPVEHFIEVPEGMKFPLEIGTCSFSKSAFNLANPYGRIARLPYGIGKFDNKRISPRMFVYMTTTSEAQIKAFEEM